MLMVSRRGPDRQIAQQDILAPNATLVCGPLSWSGHAPKNAWTFLTMARKAAGEEPPTRPEERKISEFFSKGACVRQIDGSMVTKDA
jgi:hypothetical protein